MASSLSQFITEQDAPLSANVPENSLEKVYVESMLAINAANYYLEAANLVGFADECDITTSIVQEAGDTPDAGKKNIFKKAGDAVGNAWKWIVELVRSVVKKIKGFFVKTKPVEDAKQFESIFNQFKEKYPEVKDDMTTDGFYDFVKNKFGGEKIKDFKADDLNALLKYSALCEAIERWNEVAEKLTETFKSGKTVTLEEVKTLGGKGTPEKPGIARTYYAAKSDKTDKLHKTMTLGEVIDKMSAVSDKDLVKLCDESDVVLKALSATLETEKPKRKPGPLRAEDLAEGAGGKVPESPSAQKEVIDYVKSAVNSLTSQEAETTASYNRFKKFMDAVVSEKGEKALSKMDSNGNVFESADYLV